MKRTYLRKQGKSSVSKTKRDIQSLLRSRAIERDGSCVVGKYQHWLPFTYRECGPYRNDGEIVVQAEHLVGRAHSSSYGEMDNIILLCQRHHFYFKQQHGALYWEIVRKHIGEDRWKKVQGWEQEQKSHQTTRMYASDWKKVKENLHQET